MSIKHKVFETTEKIYDLLKLDKYNIEVKLNGKKDEKISVKSNRPTSHTKKWLAKNR